MLINTDRFLILSGQRNYFYQQKNYYLNEINRIGNVLDKANHKKKKYKKILLEERDNTDRQIKRMEMDILYFREKVKQ